MFNFFVNRGLKSPELDIPTLEAYAKEKAMEGAKKVISEYFTGYKSPFAVAMEEELKAKSISWAFNFPDVIWHINSLITWQIEEFCTHSLAETLIPKIGRMLQRREKEINFSDVLKEFVNGADYDEFDDYNCEVEEDTKYGWLNVKLENWENEYSLTLHKDDKNEKKYTLLSMPRTTKFHTREISKTLHVQMPDGIKWNIAIEAPMLQDDFMAYCASIILSQTVIKMDTEEIQEDMFENPPFND